MSLTFDSLRVRTRLLLSALIIFILVLAALVVSWRGYVAVDQAGITALRYANEATYLQALIKDINQYILTEGAKAVRSRIQDSLKVIDAQLVVANEAPADTRADGEKLHKGWQDARKGVLDLLEEAKPSVENFEVLGKVVRVVARLDGLGGEVNTLAEQARSNGAETAQQVGVFVGSVFASILLFIAVIFYMLDRSLRRQLGTEPESVSRIVHKVAGGDLEVNIDPARQGFRSSSLLGAMQQMIARLTDVVRSIDMTNRQIAQSAFQIASMSREMGEANAAQQDRAQSVQLATEELTQSSSEVQVLAASATARAERTEVQADLGLQAVADNVAEMQRTVAEALRAQNELQELGESAKGINKIIESIASIAGQTNLLSLNAAIEAARAGEQGRGFAVVADEVRKLANRTSDATKEITHIVEALSGNIMRTRGNMSGLVDSANASNEKAKLTGEAIEKVVHLVRENDRSNGQITQASQAQMSKLAALSQSLETLFATLKGSHAKVSVTEQISGDLYRTVESVSKQMEYFCYDRTQHVVADQHEKRSYPRVSNSLLVTLRAASGQYQLVARDFSMGGLCLKSANTLPFEKNERIKISIMRPFDTLNEYETQKPCELFAKMAWERKEGAQILYGLEFDPSEAKRCESALASCFEFFRASPEFERA